jgi:hypothetical protein
MGSAFSFSWGFVKIDFSIFIFPRF